MNSKRGKKPNQNPIQSIAQKREMQSSSKIVIDTIMWWIWKRMKLFSKKRSKATNKTFRTRQKIIIKKQKNASDYNDDEFIVTDGRTEANMWHLLQYVWHAWARLSVRLVRSRFPSRVSCRAILRYDSFSTVALSGVRQRASQSSAPPSARLLSARTGRRRRR